MANIDQQSNIDFAFSQSGAVLRNFQMKDSKMIPASAENIRSDMRVRRKRAINLAGLLVASAVALSISNAAAFQCHTDLGRAHHSGKIITQHFVVTDPAQLIRMEFSDADNSHLRALEDIYLVATDVDGLSGDLIEDIPRQRVARKKVGSKKKKGKSNGDILPPRSSQFKGLTVSQSRGAKKQDILMQTSPALKSRTKQTERRKNVSANRSSTMPGFSSGGISDRQIAYREGIKFVERKSGKKIVETEEEKKKRRKKSGEHMYKTSAAVPDSMVQFANQIHDIQRITPKEEKFLGEKTQEAVRLQNIYDGLLLHLDREPTDEEWCAAAGKINMEAINKAIADGLEAKNKLVTSNLRMVQGVVNVYIRNGLQGQYNAGDLMQEGIMALVRAAEKFDPSRGFRFSTYAMYWIRSSIKRNQIYQSRVITVPQRLFENHKRIDRVRKELTKSLGRFPTKAELGDAVGMSEVQLDRCIAAMRQRCYSLDQTLMNPMKPANADSNENTLYDLVECKGIDSSIKTLEQNNFREDLLNALRQNLTEEEVNLLLLRYGLSDPMPFSSKSGPLTIAEISRIAGLKPDKVRRIINKSLKHLRSVIGNEWIEYEREVS